MRRACGCGSPREGHVGTACQEDLPEGVGAEIEADQGDRAGGASTGSLPDDLLARGVELPPAIVAEDQPLGPPDRAVGAPLHVTKGGRERGKLEGEVSGVLPLTALNSGCPPCWYPTLWAIAGCSSAVVAVPGSAAA